MEMQKSNNAGGTCVHIFNNTYIHVLRETLDLLSCLRKITWALASSFIMHLKHENTWCMNWGNTQLWERILREWERGFTMLHISSCRNTHWNPHSQAAGRGRKVRGTENCSKRINEKRKYLPSQFPVPKVLKPAKKCFFLSLLHSSSPPPSCFGRANVRQW